MSKEMSPPSIQNYDRVEKALQSKILFFVENAKGE
jgi:hypothetical protein